MKFRNYALAVIAAMGLTAANASAALITSASNNPLNFSWSYTTIAGTLSGSGSIQVSGFNSGLLSLLVSLSNTSVDAGSNNIRLTHFGIGIDPNATSVGFVDANDGGMVGAGSSNFPAVTQIEVCAFSGPNCAGGGPGGISIGGSDTFTINLGGTWGSSINIDPIGFKYQTGRGSFEFTTGNGCLPANAPIGFCGVTVPEPSSLPMVLMTLLSLMGFGYLGLARRARA